MNKRISVLIVDDEQEAIDYLSILIKENFPEFEIVGSAMKSKVAVQKIYRFHPDLLFLDIKIDEKDGFDILKDIKNDKHFPHVIFVTAFDHFAIEAFKVNAIDYLLKPVEKEELKRAVIKYLDLTEKESYLENIKNLFSSRNGKIRFNSRTGYILIDPDDIFYCQSDGNYSEIYLVDGSRKIVTYNLRTLITLLTDESFTRISRFHVINENYLSEVDKGKHICMLKSGSTQISLSYSSRIFKV